MSTSRLLLDSYMALLTLIRMQKSWKEPLVACPSHTRQRSRLEQRAEETYEGRPA